MKTMIKNIIILLLLISQYGMAQSELSIEQRWSESEELPFLVMGSSLYFSKVNGSHYAEFDIQETEENVSSVFYPDIERSMLHASFLMINDDLKLIPIIDSTLTQELFLKTDFRTEWSPAIYEGDCSAVDNSDGTRTYDQEIICNYGGKSYYENVSYTMLPFEWNLVTSSIISDESGLNAVYFCPINHKDIFARVFFIHFNSNQQKIEIEEKKILNKDLGFDANKILPVTNYADHEFRMNDKPGLLFRFNLDSSSYLGLSTFLFDLAANEVKIQSIQLNEQNLSLLNDFNEVPATINVNSEYIDYFVRLTRTKITKRGVSNTQLDSRSGEDILYIKLEDGNYKETRKFLGLRKNYHLLHYSRLHDDFIFIYDKKPEEIEFDKTIIRGKNSKFKLWVVQFSGNTKTLYEIGFDYKEIDSSINDTYFTFSTADSTINIIAYLSGSMFEPTKDYLIGKINITAAKRH
jgi:hypothetical protein